MKCYSYLTDQEYTQALIRLTKMIRGIGDPLVACYARAYLCRVGMSLAPEIKTHLLPNFTDYLATLSQVCGCGWVYVCGWVWVGVCVCGCMNMIMYDFVWCLLPLHVL